VWTVPSFGGKTPLARKGEPRTQNCGLPGPEGDSPIFCGGSADSDGDARGAAKSATVPCERVPPLPKDCAREGSFAGLRARGGYRVDCAWKDGRVVSFRIVADKAPDRHAKVKVRVDGELREIVPEP
jgi:hypothetical protein